MENNLKHSLHMLLNSAMKDKDEFITKVCEMIENKDCNCNCHSTVDLGSGKSIDKDKCDCIMSGECSCGDDCNCGNQCDCNHCSCNHKSHHHHHKHATQAIIRELAKISESIDQLNETLKHGRKQQ